MPRTRPVSVGSTTTEVGLRPRLLNRRAGDLTRRCWVAAVVSLTGVTVGCDSSADPATTTIEVSPPTTPVEQTVPVTPTTKAAPTTAASTTVAVTVPDTTQPATKPPPTTSVQDQLIEAINRAQTAMRNCYKAAPGCDQQELESALVGVQLQGFIDRSQSGKTYENVDALTWTVLDGPTLKGNELAIATVCAVDALVTVRPDGSRNDDKVAALQEWYLVPVGNTWKLSEINNLQEAPTEVEACGT